MPVLFLPFHVTDQLHVTAQFYLESKGNMSLKPEGGLTRKMCREEKPPILLGFFLLHICLLP